MSNRPIVFNIRYTPYKLSNNATAAEREQHASDRAFFDMTGGKNIFDYITTEEKCTGGYSMFDYLQKNTGVFNETGMLSERDIASMKARLKENRGVIWHGFVSLGAEDSYKIDSPEKCIRMVKQIFPTFFRDMKLNPRNVDLMCALHLDKPHHLHCHFVFWEKEPKFKDAKSGQLVYRRQGKVRKDAIDKMFVRLGVFFSDKKEVLYKSRDEAIRDLKELLGAKAFVYKPEDVKKEILSLARDIPQGGRVTYGSKDMEPYRARVDKIVQMLLLTDRRARMADRRFHRTLAGREREIANICGQPFAYSNKNISPEKMESELPKYHNVIDGKNIRIIDEIKADYKRRQGNLVVNLAKSIKPECYENKRKRKVNDHALKRTLAISKKKIGGSFKEFLNSFGAECEYIERDYCRRLQEIEEEMKREKEKEDTAEHGGETK